MSNQLEESLKKSLEELEKKKQELEAQLKAAQEPLTIKVEQVQIGGAGAYVDIRLSKMDENVVNILRKIPSRYWTSRGTNQFQLDQWPRTVADLKERGYTIEVGEAFQAKIDEWFTSPDFRVSYDEKKKQIRIDRTLKQKSLPYFYEIGSWAYHGTGNYYTFNANELLQFFRIATSDYPNFRFEYSDDVLQRLREIEEREKLLDQFATMEDAPEIDYEFKWRDNNGIEHAFQLKPDQRVACKFDDTFSNRTLLSFDMGKGKTAIAVAQVERNNERVLFVCKASLKTNIKREIKKFTGKDAIVFSGIEPDRVAVDLLIANKKQYNIINYEVIGREIKADPTDKASPGIMKWVELINFSQFDRIIYDEAHYMKNVDTQMSRGGRALKSKKTMLLTGTPIVNRPGEIWPILNIIDPQTFPDFTQFERQFTMADRKTPKNLKELHSLLKRYMIRRLRDNSNDPTRITQYHNLTEQARRTYNDVLEGVYRSLRNPDYERNVTNILTELLRCKQVCADDKVDFTVDLAETALDETSDHTWSKVLIFSQFKNTQSEILNKISPIYRPRIINGDVTDKARYEIIDRFQDKNDPCKVVITNIVEGLTLTEAFTVIFNDLWWTPKDHLQSEGRAFGRTNDPHGGNSYYVLAQDTIDELIWDILARKMNISKSVIDGVYTKYEEESSLVKDLMKQLKAVAG